MVKARFRRVTVSDGDEIEFTGSILAPTLTIHADPERQMMTHVAWLEEMKE